MLMCGPKKEVNGHPHWWCWASLEPRRVSSGLQRETSLLLGVATDPSVCVTLTRATTGGPRRRSGSPSGPPSPGQLVCKCLGM